MVFWLSLAAETDSVRTKQCDWSLGTQKQSVPCTRYANKVKTEDSRIHLYSREEKKKRYSRAIKAIFHDNYITLTPFNARDLKSTWQISDTFHQAIAYEVDIIRILLTTFYFTLLWRKGYSEELKPGVVRTTWANWL